MNDLAYVFKMNLSPSGSEKSHWQFITETGWLENVFEESRMLLSKRYLAVSRLSLQIIGILRVNLIWKWL